MCTKSQYILSKTNNKPVLVRFFTSREVKVAGNEMTSTLTINLNSFNNDSVSQQLYGYIELFDQFKILCQTMDMHFRTSAEYTDLDTSIPHVFWVYDGDLKRQTIDLFNMTKLQNMRHKLLPPLNHLRLTATSVDGAAVGVGAKRRQFDFGYAYGEP